MVATIVVLMLVAWLVCTAAMTFASRQGLREHESPGALGIHHVSGGPVVSPPISSPISSSEPPER